MQTATILRNQRAEFRMMVNRGCSGTNRNREGIRHTKLSADR